MSDWYVGFRTQYEYILWFHANDIILPDITSSGSLLAVLYAIIIIFRVCLHFILLLFPYFLVWTAIDSSILSKSCWGTEIGLANEKHSKQNENELHSFEPCTLYSCIVLIIICALSSVGIFPFEKHLYDHCLQLRQRKNVCISFTYGHWSFQVQSFSKQLR